MPLIVTKSILLSLLMRRTQSFSDYTVNKVEGCPCFEALVVFICMLHAVSNDYFLYFEIAFVFLTLFWSYIHVTWYVSRWLFAMFCNWLLFLIFSTLFWSNLHVTCSVRCKSKYPIKSEWHAGLAWYLYIVLSTFRWHKKLKPISNESMQKYAVDNVFLSY